jgi:hypothetical protein
MKTFDLKFLRAELTSAVMDEPCRMLIVIQRFGKRYSCHLQGFLLEAVCGVGSRWRVGFDGADWWGGGVGCCRDNDPLLHTLKDDNCIICRNVV